VYQQRQTWLLKERVEEKKAKVEKVRGNFVIQLGHTSSVLYNFFNVGRPGQKSQPK
jgi:hypothetical protein